MQNDFIFPDDLQKEAVQKARALQQECDTLKTDPHGFFEGRITDIKFKGSDGSVMSFRLDGKPTKDMPMSVWQMAMMDTGQITAYQLAVHFCQCSGNGFPQQRTLF